MNCPEPGCTGDVGPDGYCNVSGMKVSTLADASSATDVVEKQPSVDSGLPKSPTGRRREGQSRRPVAEARRRGIGWAAVSSTSRRSRTRSRGGGDRGSGHPREQARCSVDGEPVGRSRDGEPGRTEGFCRKCGAPFSFMPKLARVTLVAASTRSWAASRTAGSAGSTSPATDNAYSVGRAQGPAQHRRRRRDGGRDRRAPLPRRGRAPEHRARSINFVEHGGDGYIVMEYVGGTSLQAMLDERRGRERRRRRPAAGRPRRSPTCLEILPALGYLHRRGLLFCDFKPDNVIQTEDSLKLIDLGGVYRIGRRRRARSTARRATRRRRSPTTGPDGRLGPLHRRAHARRAAAPTSAASRARYEFTLPPPATVAAVRAVRLAVPLPAARRPRPTPTTGSSPPTRWRDQLYGVLREIVAARSGTPAPAAEHAASPASCAARSTRPTGARCRRCSSHADDPAAGYLASLSAPPPTTPTSSSPRSRSSRRDASRSSSGWRARSIEARRLPTRRATVLDEIEPTHDPWEWRVDVVPRPRGARARQPSAARRRVRRRLPHAPRRARAEAGARRAPPSRAATSTRRRAGTRSCRAPTRRTRPRRSGSPAAAWRSATAPARSRRTSACPDTSSAYVDAQVAKARAAARRRRPPPSPTCAAAARSSRRSRSRAKRGRGSPPTCSRPRSRCVQATGDVAAARRRSCSGVRSPSRTCGSASSAPTARWPGTRRRQPSGSSSSTRRTACDRGRWHMSSELATACPQCGGAVLRRRPVLRGVRCARSSPPASPTRDRVELDLGPRPA